MAMGTGCGTSVTLARNRVKQGHAPGMRVRECSEDFLKADLTAHFQQAHRPEPGIAVLI
jgi:hypothetical protein